MGETPVEEAGGNLPRLDSGRGQGAPGSILADDGHPDGGDESAIAQGQEFLQVIEVSFLVEKAQFQPVQSQALERPGDALLDFGRSLGFGRPLRDVRHLGHNPELADQPEPGQRLANDLLAFAVGGGRIQGGHPAIAGDLEDGADRIKRRPSGFVGDAVINPELDRAKGQAGRRRLEKRRWEHGNS